MDASSRHCWARPATAIALACLVAACGGMGHDDRVDVTVFLSNATGATANLTARQLPGQPFTDVTLGTTVIGLEGPFEYHGSVDIFDVEGAGIEFEFRYESTTTVCTIDQEGIDVMNAHAHVTVSGVQCSYHFLENVNP